MLEGNISMRQNVKKLISDVFEGGKTVNFAAEALNTIYELEP
jgi:predicted amidophosphoribosyltransferase